ncbi:hypothetical protein BHK69_05365 [Bosea vaviloviae]|uniref:Uncharacterized protein n=1 Tax=Bosea vaviloviae TaxID=1526658 RepID=A0A1D7TXY7_9HYPH|nr:hypothetical protein BHK69_05365 [Bosea vaviloviae]
MTRALCFTRWSGLTHCCPVGGLAPEQIMHDSPLTGEGDAKCRMKGAGNPSPVWEKGRDEGPPLVIEAQRSRNAFY